jgi:hypothetical protein
MASILSREWKNPGGGGFGKFAWFFWYDIKVKMYGSRQRSTDNYKEEAVKKECVRHQEIDSTVGTQFPFRGSVAILRFFYARDIIRAVIKVCSPPATKSLHKHSWPVCINLRRKSI